jgi:hypothetical protein
VPTGDIFVRQYPVVLSQTPDGAAALEYLAHRAAHLSGFLSNDFKCKGHYAVIHRYALTKPKIMPVSIQVLDAGMIRPLSPMIREALNAINMTAITPKTYLAAKTRHPMAVRSRCCR